MGGVIESVHCRNVVDGLLRLPHTLRPAGHLLDVGAEAGLIPVVVTLLLTPLLPFLKQLPGLDLRSAVGEHLCQESELRVPGPCRLDGGLTDAFVLARGGQGL